MTTTSPAPGGANVESKGLKGGALGLLGSIVVGVASTAPAYSLAASLGFVVATASGSGIIGVKAPAVMLLAFVPMFFIAIAYQELNKAEPDCGTTFTWAARAFGPRTGWMGGWGIVAADVIVMANLAQIAGAYSFDMVGADSLADSQLWSTVAGIVWIVVMTYICYRGIEVSARLSTPCSASRSRSWCSSRCSPWSRSTPATLPTDRSTRACRGSRPPASA